MTSPTSDAGTDTAVPEHERLDVDGGGGSDAGGPSDDETRAMWAALADPGDVVPAEHLA